MATPPFARFNVERPVVTDARQAAIDSIRNNQIAMYLNAALYGGIGWTSSVIERDSEGRATRCIATNQDDQVAVMVTHYYHTAGAGAAEGSVSLTGVHYSTDYTGDQHAATWMSIGYVEFYYDSTGNLVSAPWSYE
jgi:hypothetical protein